MCIEILQLIVVFYNQGNEFTSINRRDAELASPLYGYLWNQNLITRI